MGESAAMDKALVGAARDGVGPDVSLLVDAACVWPDARTALARARSFEPYDLFLLEEPLHPDDIDGYVWWASFLRYVSLHIEVRTLLMRPRSIAAMLDQVARPVTGTDRSWRERKRPPRVFAMD